MKTRGRIPTDEEISQLMDFDGLMRDYAAAKQSLPPKTNGWYKGWIIGGAILVGTFVLYQLWENNAADKSEAFTNDLPTPTVEKPVEPQAPITTHDTVTQVVGQDKKKQPNLPNVEKPLAKVPATSEGKLEATYVAAEPVNGFPDLYAYFDRELKYPTGALADSIQGVESVSFLVDKQGKTSKIEIQQSLGELFDKEVIRLLQNMPPWKPATLNGNPVISKQSIPFTFRVTQSKK